MIIINVSKCGFLRWKTFALLFMWHYHAPHYKHRPLNTAYDSNLLSVIFQLISFFISYPTRIDGWMHLLKPRNRQSTSPPVVLWLNLSCRWYSRDCFKWMVGVAYLHFYLYHCLFFSAFYSYLYVFRFFLNQVFIYLHRSFILFLVFFTPY